MRLRGARRNLRKHCANFSEHRAFLCIGVGENGRLVNTQSSFNTNLLCSTFLLSVSLKMMLWVNFQAGFLCVLGRLVYAALKHLPFSLTVRYKLSSIKLYLFPLKLSFGVLEIIYFGGFWRCGISLPAMRTIFINDAHYLWQWSALSLKVVFCRVGANMLLLVFSLSSELNIKAAILIRRMAAFIILWWLVCLWLQSQVELQKWTHLAMVFARCDG